MNPAKLKPGEKGTITVAVAGNPDSGKSTLINATAGGATAAVAIPKGRLNSDGLEKVAISAYGTRPVITDSSSVASAAIIGY